MEEVNVYGHYGAGNHGNEAIIRGLKEILGDSITINVFSMNADKDIQFGLNKICSLFNMSRSIRRYSIINIIGALQYRLFNSNSIRYKKIFSPMLVNVSSKTYVLEMGDQYCENKYVTDMYAWLNKEIHKRGGKTIALGGSINEEQVERECILNDLLAYDKIILRESLSYDLLLKRGFQNISLAPDPAFYMKEKKCRMDKRFQKEKIVGIVVGGIAQGNELKTDSLINDIILFINNLLNTTKYTISLIPHVNVGGVLDDVRYQEIIKNEFINTERVFCVSEHRADEIKYIISKCHVLVTLRTHASIASYSSFVPTIVLGYSIKSKGIAVDLFGMHDEYVINIKKNDTYLALIESFEYIEKNYDNICEMLSERMDEYSKSKLMVRNIVLF